MNKSSLDELWFKNKKCLQKPDLIKKLQSFDIRKFTPQKLDKIKKLYYKDPFMTFNWIRRESRFASHLFLWIQAMIEYIEVSSNLRKLGV